MTVDNHQTESKIALEYEAIRRREYELINELLTVLPKINTLGEERVAQVRDALFHADHPFLMVFVGPFSSGKSSLINALLGETVLRVGPTPTTDRISILRYGDSAQSMESGGEVDTVFYPSPLLRKVSFVDTPGLESIFKEHEELTRKFLHRSDVVMLTMLATQAMSQRNLDYLKQLREFGKKVIIIINQADLLNDDERKQVRDYVMEQSRDKLGYQPDIWMMSAKQGLAARAARARIDKADTLQALPNVDTQNIQVSAEQVSAEEEGVAESSAPTPQVADVVNPQQLWKESGLHQLEDYIDRQLGDVDRLKQKLQTPLQITQNAHRVALDGVKANQAVLDQYQGIAENVQGQLAAYRREQEKIVREGNEELRAQFAEAANRGSEALRDTFMLSRAVSSVGRGLMEVTGISRLLRRGGQPSYTRVAFERYKAFEPLEKLPDLVDRLGPRLEGKDLQDTDDLVKYARKEVDALPETIRGKVIGSIQSPMSYERKAIAEIRPKLEAIEARAKQNEAEQMEQRLRSIFFSLAIWELIILMLAVIAVIAGQLTPTILILLLTAALLGLVATPLIGRWLASGYRNRLYKLQEEYIEVLSKATDAQVEYGMGLRRDVVAPLTRLVETQTSIQTEQLNTLQKISQEMVAIESDLNKLGKRKLFGIGH